MEMQNLNALRTFIYVAESLSFTDAAKSLYLSQSAVSVQIKQLEDELGFKLFHRKVRQIHLTEKGEALLETLAPALEKIDQKIEYLQELESDRKHLTVTTLSSFANKWLIPHLSEFTECCPGIDLRIHTSDHMVNFVRDKIHCAIRFGWGDYPGLISEKIMTESYFPVCSPNLLKKKKLSDLNQLAEFPLLHDNFGFPGDCGSWDDWADVFDLDNLALKEGLRFNQSDYVLLSAIAGQGVALARASLVKADLDAGLLVRMFKESISPGIAYYFVYPEQYTDYPQVQMFRNWIFECLGKCCETDQQ